jgi:hypothetical protein
VASSAEGGRPRRVAPAERGMLALPIARDRTDSSKEGQQLVGCDLLYSPQLSQCATERLEDACFRAKAHAHCLSMGDISRNNLREIHDSPQVKIRHLSQPRQVDPGIGAGGIGASVTEVVADFLQAQPLSKEVRRASVAKTMGTVRGGLDAQCVQSAAD